jgi:tetratricopeptide (TPR) repeat protein/predicted Ser/Thr protein kinase
MSLLNASAPIAGRYRVLSRLGEGGMGAVYRVFDEMVGEEVALKVLTDATPASTERFRAEVRLARRITHGNVGRTYDIGMDHDVLFITMELLQGQTIREWLQRGQWADTAVSWVAWSAARGLAAAHRAEVVHRDLKPSNLVVTDDDRVVIIDWGIAAFRDAGEGVAGTLDYMAPEQLLGHPPTPAQDVYSLGLVMFELLAGARPFAGDSSTHRARERLDREPDFALLPSDSRLTPIVQRCLTRDPAARPSATELEALLSRFAGAGAVPSSRGRPTPTREVEEPPTTIEAPRSTPLESLPHAALMAYLQGRSLLHSPARDFALALEALQRCVNLAPSFLPAVAARALAATYTLVYAVDPVSDARVDGAVADAEERAAQFADTRVSRALLQLREADYQGGITSLAHALRLDPRHARAHEQLGRIECEAGHADRGIRRLLGTVAMDPSVRPALAIVGRAHALRGQVDLLDETLAFSATLGPLTYEEAVLEARFACWWGNQERAARLLARLDEAIVGPSIAFRFAAGIARATIDHEALWSLRALYRSTTTSSRRLHLSRLQSAAEVEGALGDPLLSLQALETANTLGLIDVEWLARCPALDVLRDFERFDVVVEAVNQRARSLWTAAAPELPAG